MATSAHPTRMDAFDTDYCGILAKAIEDDAGLTPARVLANLRKLEPIVQEFAVHQLVRALQTATRAERAGEDLDLIVGALCHDMAKTIINANHDAIAGEMVRPYLSEDVTWMVSHHQDFQGKHYYHVLGLDPDYDTLPLEHFEPMVHEVFSRDPSTIL